MADRFEDHRGVIQDLLGQVDAVTEIYTRAGSLRGNHLHRQTTQWTYIVSGHMRIVNRDPDGTTRDQVYGPGELSCSPPGTAHAWQTADEDCTVLVFARGPRAGEAYESDVIRLTGEDRLLT